MDLLGGPRRWNQATEASPEAEQAPLQTLSFAEVYEQVMRQRRPAAAWEGPGSVGAPAWEDLTEAVPQGGRGTFRHAPLGGAAGPNVEVRWNVDQTTVAGTPIHVVVHLHGHGTPATDFIARKARTAGVELLDGSGNVRVRASRPTLVLVPRGEHRSGKVWTFTRVLPDVAAFNALVDAGLEYLAGNVLRLPPPQILGHASLTVMAHSGGGSGLSQLLSRGLDPDEVVCFDSMYGGEGPIIDWALRRLRSPQAATSALRVFYTACGSWSWTYSTTERRWMFQSTEVSARRTQHALTRALATMGSSASALARRFRVERTGVGHDDIPSRYTSLLLEDISADMPNASPPPAVSVPPACVENSDWLTARPRRRGGEAPPGGSAPPAAGNAPQAAPNPARPGEDSSEDFSEEVYSAPDARAYTPLSDASLFRTPPSPVGVAPATQWPEPSAQPDDASTQALRALGVTAAFPAQGLAALRPIAAKVGAPMLTELLGRLRYTPAQLAAPPHSYRDAAELRQAFGKPVPQATLLAMRVLLALPGHFRELARRAGTEQEAHALECLGWLLMHSLRGEVASATGLDFWLPDSPTFVSPFSNTLPSLSPQAHRLILRTGLIDTMLELPAFLGRYNAWRTGAPGRMWRLETGRESAQGRPAGAPFYPQVFTLPAAIDISTQRAQVQAAWRRRVANFDAGTTTTPLTQCDNSYLSSLNLTGPISLRGLQLRAHFPSPTRMSNLQTLTGLTAVRPAFEAAFQAVAELGWNDLLFETQGMGCFRGKKIPGNPAAARNMSEHSLAIAIDVNAFENTQNTAGSMDPRIVALFEAFRFRWGKGFSTPDPMHFEYSG